jgi:3-oxoadipate enol-lactonase/4-carboxymuconolactone decarboxylase
LHYRLDGDEDAPPLLLLCPIGTELHAWDPLIPALARHHRVIRCDTRGHGKSPAPKGPYTIAELGSDVIALLDGLGVPRASVCGSSLGGMIAMWLAVHEPARVDRLALLCTAAQLGTAQGWHERAAQVRAQGTREAGKQSVPRWFTPAFAARMPALIAEMEDMVARTPAEGYAACCEAVASWDIRPQLASIAAPTLVIAGAEDAATTPAYAYAIGAAVPECRVEVIAGAAHFAAVERPLLVARLLLEHLDPRGVGFDGERVRRSVLGDAHVDRAQARANAFNAPFQDLITRHAWADVWTRPGLTRAERSLVTLAALASLHHDDELAVHSVAALRNGLTVEQIQEALLQLAIYAGVPAANHAFKLVEQALTQAGALEAPAAERKP